MSDWLVDLRRLSGNLIQFTAARISWSTPVPHSSLSKGKILTPSKIGELVRDLTWALVPDKKLIYPEL